MCTNDLQPSMCTFQNCTGFGSTTQELFGARLQIHDPRPHTHTVCVHDTKLSQCMALVQTIQRLVKKRPTTWDRASPQSPRKKRDQKLYLQTNVHLARTS